MVQSSQEFYSYLNIMNDALNIFWETTQGAASSLFTRIPRNSLENAVIKLKAKSIIKKWKWLNQDYVSYLREIRMAKASQNPA